MAMMRASVLALIGGAILSVPLRAELRIKMKQTLAGRTTTSVEYCKGNRWRSDSEPSGSYWIVDSANKGTITVDPVNREYSVNAFTPAEPITNPSQTIVIEIETRDTGEQQQKFGHLLHHVITTERRHTEYPDKPSSETREIMTDGWYMDVPVPFPSPSRIGMVAVFSTLTIDQHGRQAVPAIKVTRRGRAPHGLPVWEKTGENLLEVTEFSEAPLDQSLFDPPKGFRRVVHPFPAERLSWSDQLLFRWRQFEDWLSGLL
jgi:hypothetical protein